MKMRHRIRGVLVLGALAGLAVPAGRADWLVTREGARVETQGAWTVRGKLVVFTTPNGTLSSLRLDQVDLDASRRATAAAVEHAAKPAETRAPKPRKRSVRVLTDADFKPVGRPPGEEEATAEDGAEAPAGGVSSGGLEVVSWERVAEPGEEGVRIAGTVRNNSNAQATDLEVYAQLYDEAGTLIARLPAELETSTLGPGEGAQWSVASGDVASFSSIRFQVRSRGFRAGGPEPQPADAAGEPVVVEEPPSPDEPPGR